jgi:regulator of sigma E protease
MFAIVSSILAFIVAISVLVAVHEYGHFWVARRLGFKVLRYSIGFGKPLAKWRGKGPDHTEYWLSSIPLGGYVKLLDEREGPVPEEDAPRAFNRRPIPHRIAVLLAGPGFNFLFAIVAYWAMFVSGVPGIKPIVGMVTEGSVAAQSGLRTDDQILSVGGRATATWEGALIAILDELLDDGRLDLVVLEANGNERQVELDVRGRESELTEPNALFTGLGFTPGPTMPADISKVDPDSPAELAGLRAGDRVVRVSGANVPSERIQSWQQWLEVIRQYPGETVNLDVQRDGSSVQLDMTIGEVEEEGQRIGRIGAWRPTSLPADLLERIQAEQRYGVVESLVQGTQKTWEMSALTVRMLVRMFTGDVSYRNVSGPISIATYAGESAAAGFTAFLSFLAIVSISLGIMNLLPVPLLDGGQIVYQLVELFKGSPLSERAMIMGQQLGIMLLIVLMSFVFYNDLTRMFG